MKLSIVIVNYNVRHFLEQCLLSVQKACAEIEAEVFVVDNASKDDSVQMVRERFPQVKLIANTDNTGFSKANNQAMALAKGEYVLLLNPDTVVAEDTFTKCIAFMDAHADAGALGVRMVDGKGNFLPESKRGLPTPAVAFYKSFGLSALFPTSTTFGRYHLGFLSQHATHPVDILSGAFMFMRKSVLDQIGFFDETFFMYGEDVDLSYRVIKAGYKNYYFHDTTIIHYKGESTRKGSLNYVKVFYNAMRIFAEKHFSANQSGLFSLLINMAIVFRGLLTLLSGVFASSYLFVIDALLSFGGIFLIKTYWENMIKYSEHYYPGRFLWIVVPAYITVWIVAAFLNGGYDKPYRISNIFRGIVMGTIFIAVMYAFIPNEWRFSRAMILLGAMWTGLEMIGTRTLYHLVRFQSLSAEADNSEHLMIVGTAESVRAKSILNQLGNAAETVIVNDLTAVKKQAAIHGVTEVVFCAADFGYLQIIEQMAAAGNRIRYKILNPGSDALIGSNSKDGAGDLYVAEKSYALFKADNLRKKRLMDVLLCIAVLPLLPLLMFTQQKMLHNWWQVLSGKQSWVGLKYMNESGRFPHAVSGVVHPAAQLRGFTFSEAELLQIELHYARHYTLSSDVSILFKRMKSR